MAAGLAATTGTVARRLFLDRQAAFWRRELSDPRARVVAVVAETRDTKTFVLQPGAGWRAHRAGQYTTIEVEIGGVRLHRCYSLSSAPADRHVAITVKRLPGGRVSSWLHDRVRVGDRIGVAPAAGAFVLPTLAPEQLLLVSGGSGITPIMSMLRQLANERALQDAVLVHHAHSREDVIFRDALERLAAVNPGLRLVFCLSDGSCGAGRFDEQQLRRIVPDFAARSTFLCGPPGLMARVEQMWRAAGAAERLQRERFVADVPPAGAADEPVLVHLARSGRSLVGNTSRPLLEQLERGGIEPAYGCRVGICHTCQCRKRVGTVENLLTGAVSSEADEDIQLCISVPRSDVELNL